MKTRSIYTVGRTRIQNDRREIFRKRIANIDTNTINALIATTKRTKNEALSFHEKWAHTTAKMSRIAGRNTWIFIYIECYIFSGKTKETKDNFVKMVLTYCLLRNPNIWRIKNLYYISILKSGRCIHIINTPLFKNMSIYWNFGRYSFTYLSSHSLMILTASVASKNPFTLHVPGFFRSL